MPKPLPKLIQTILSRIHTVEPNELVTLFTHEVAREDDMLLKSLSDSGLLKSLRSAPECIQCGSETTLRGRKGKQVAICDACSSVFIIQLGDGVIYQASFCLLGEWVYQLLAFPDEPEGITSGVYYLGNYTAENGKAFEIHLLHDESSDRERRLQQIVQQMTAPALVLSSSRKPTPFKHDRIQLLSLHGCLKVSDSHLVWQWPRTAFDFKSADKQMAAHMRYAKDPKQQCKTALKKFIAKNVNGMFRNLMHPDIRKTITEQNLEQLTYTDSNGKKQTLSKQMTLDAIKEVLKEKGLEEKISGVPSPYN